MCIIERNDRNLLKNVSLFDLRNALFNDEEPSQTVNMETLNSTITGLINEFSTKINDLNKNIIPITDNLVNVDSLKEDIKANKIVSGLSYITILVCITIMYVHYGSDLSLNSK